MENHSDYLNLLKELEEAASNLTVAEDKFKLLLEKARTFKPCQQGTHNE